MFELTSILFGVLDLLLRIIATIKSLLGVIAEVGHQLRSVEGARDTLLEIQKNTRLESGQAHLDRCIRNCQDTAQKYYDELNKVLNSSVRRFRWFMSKGTLQFLATQLESDKNTLAIYLASKPTRSNRPSPPPPSYTSPTLPSTHTTESAKQFKAAKTANSSKPRRSTKPNRLPARSSLTSTSTYSKPDRPESNFRPGSNYNRCEDNSPAMVAIRNRRSGLNRRRGMGAMSASESNFAFSSSSAAGLGRNQQFGTLRVDSDRDAFVGHLARSDFIGIDSDGDVFSGSVTDTTYVGVGRDGDCYGIGTSEVEVSWY